jgi:uncharacterized membrane protein HdeD (DUF308 family)
MAMTETNPAAILVGTVARNWGLILLRGLAAIAFGIVCFVGPALGLLALVLVYGVYALVDGIGAIVWGARSRWGAMVAVGAISVLAGLIALFWPGITALALLYVIAAWAIIRGVAEIGAAVHLRRKIENEWYLVLGGFASIVFGVLIALFPAAGVLSVLWLIGALAIIFGGFAVALALRLRAWDQTKHVEREEVPVGAARSDRTSDDDLR